MSLSVKIDREKARENVECCVDRVKVFCAFAGCALLGAVLAAFLFGPFLPQMICGIDIHGPWAFMGMLFPLLFLDAVFAVTVFVQCSVNRNDAWKSRCLLAVPVLLLGTGHWIIGTVGCVQKLPGDSMGFAHVLCSVSFIAFIMLAAIALWCLSCIEIAWSDDRKVDAEKGAALASP